MIRFTRPCKGLMLAAGIFLGLSLSHAKAVDWVTNDGKTYQNVSVIKVEPDAVTIIYRNGGALVPLENLPVYLQQKFNYDPVKAQLAADARAKQEAADAKALQAEMDLTAKKKNAQLIQEAKAKQAANATVQH